MGLPPRYYNMPKKPGNFYQNNYEPDIVCQHERRIGRLGDGEKWICDLHRISDQKDCLVYSVGSNTNEFSFEEAVLDKIGHHCEIHTVSAFLYDTYDVFCTHFICVLLPPKLNQS